MPAASSRNNEEQNGGGYEGEWIGGLEAIEQGAEEAGQGEGGDQSAGNAGQSEP